MSAPFLLVGTQTLDEPNGNFASAHGRVGLQRRALGRAMTDSSVLVLVAKWPGSGASKTRLASQLIAAGTSEDDAKKWTAEFTRASVHDLVVRLKRLPPWCSFALLYSPPVDEARAYFSALLDEADCSDYGWILMPVLASSDPRAKDLGGILADAAVRAKEVTGAGIVAFCGSDCPELPGSSVKYCLEAAFGSTDKPAAAAICPATDGGFTLLALPAHADPAQCFSGVKWSAPDKRLSQPLHSRVLASSVSLARRTPTSMSSTI